MDLQLMALLLVGLASLRGLILLDKTGDRKDDDDGGDARVPTHLP